MNSNCMQSIPKTRSYMYKFIHILETVIQDGHNDYKATTESVGPVYTVYKLYTQDQQPPSSN